jgi:hypothetical protein
MILDEQTFISVASVLSLSADQVDEGLITACCFSKSVSFLISPRLNEAMRGGNKFCISVELASPKTCGVASERQNSTRIWTLINAQKDYSYRSHIGLH